MTDHPSKPGSPSPLPFTGGAGGGPDTPDQASPPLTPPVNGRGTERAVPTRAIPRQATSAVAHIAPPPADDDPLLAFVPYLHKQPRSNSITPDRQRRFVATLAATGIVSQAARSIGKSMEALYKLRARPGAEGFAGAWDAALARGVQRLEDCALERSLRGTPTPIVSGGAILGTWDKPDNTLLRFLLQHRLPQKYGTESAGTRGPAKPMTRDEAIAADKRSDEICAGIDAKLDLMRRRMLEQRWRDRAEARARAAADRQVDSDAMVSAAAGTGLMLPAGCVG